MYFNGNTHPGKQRKENQDAFGCHILWDKHKVLLLVVDGVGGYAGGEQAANIARVSIENYMRSPKGDLLTMLRESVIHANNRIVEERKNNPEFFEMCCVLTAAVADLLEEKLYFVHVGDTRLYRFRSELLQKLTRDHSFVGIREDAGELTEAEAMKHPQRNQILREVGSAFHRIDDEDFLDYGIRDFVYGDQILLCSDGLTDMITANQITEVLKNQNPVATKVNTLIRLANEMGGFDNITVVMMQNTRRPIHLTKKNPVTESRPDHVSEEGQRNLSKSAPGFPIKKILLRSILLLIFFAGTSWYFLNIHEDPESTVQTLPHKQVQVRDTTKYQLLFATRSPNPALPVPPQPLLPDTFRISKTWPLTQLQNRADSLKNTLIILPAGGSGNFLAAFASDSSLQPGDTLQVRNLHFSNFDTGIELPATVPVKFENVVFDQVSNPLRRKKTTAKSEKKLLTSLNP